METNELIAALVADDVPPKHPHMMMRALLGALIAAAIMFATMGPRADLGAAIREVPVLAKQALPLLLVAMAGWGLFASTPARRAALWPVGVVGAGAALVWVGSALTGGDVMGQSALACAVSIPFLALPLGAVLFAGLRHQVEPHAARRGLAAGLFAGAVAAALYAVHCDEDSPAFFLLWYGLGIAICGLVGRAAGRRLLGV